MTLPHQARHCIAVKSVYAKTNKDCCLF